MRSLTLCDVSPRPCDPVAPLKRALPRRPAFRARSSCHYHSAGMREATRSRPAPGGRPPAPARPAARAPQAALGPRGRIVALLVGLLVIVVGVGVALGAASGGDDAPAAVEVDGVNVSGLSPDEVERAVRYRARQLMAQPLVIVREDRPDRPIRVHARQPRRPAPGAPRGRGGARAAQPGRRSWAASGWCRRARCRSGSPSARPA